jgi:hypothetical protein
MPPGARRVPVDEGRRDLASGPAVRSIPVARRKVVRGSSASVFDLGGQPADFGCLLGLGLGREVWSFEALQAALKRLEQDLNRTGEWELDGIEQSGWIRWITYLAQAAGLPDLGVHAVPLLGVGANLHDLDPRGDRLWLPSGSVPGVP